MDVDVVIVGSGFGGLCAGARLRQRGHTDFVILEKDDGVGGTWRANTYPGAACDVPSHLYSFSFARSAAWSRRYAPQHEILAYLEGCVDRFGLGPHLRFGSEVVSARFEGGHAEGARWHVRTRDGASYRARMLVTATGGLSRPKRPDIPGLDTFAGPVLHSARWDHDVPLDGARVGVIGTGASAIQVVPALAPRVGQLTVFQRTPPWILPRHDRPYTALERSALRHVPGLGWLVRMWLYWRHEVRATAFVRDVPRIRRLVEGWAQRHLAAQVPDEALRHALTPGYAIGCKRILLSDDYYPALTQPHVGLVTDPIVRVDPRGVHTASGAHHELDRLVLCTGFAAAEDMAPFEIIGRDGADLRERWQRGGSAYLGTMVAGFPNLFVLVGPNTGLGHSSMVFMIECQVRYMLALLRSLRRRGGRTVEVTDDAQQGFEAWLQARMGSTVWVRGGCQSWYLSEDGRNTTLWPAFTLDFERRTRAPVPAHFRWG